MTYKSLLTDEIEVNIQEGIDGYWWSIFNCEEFSISILSSEGNYITKLGAKKNFIATAKRNGWTKWKFVE